MTPTMPFRQNSVNSELQQQRPRTLVRSSSGPVNELTQYGSSNSSESLKTQVAKAVKLAIAIPDAASPMTPQLTIDTVDKVTPGSLTKAYSESNLNTHSPVSSLSDNASSPLSDIIASSPDGTGENRGYIRINGSMLLIMSMIDVQALDQHMKQKSLSQIHFHKVPFDEIMEKKQTLMQYSKVFNDSLTLTHNMIHSLEQMEMICQIFPRVKRLFISDNPLFTNLKRILKPFCINHMTHLAEFNGRQVQSQDRVNAEKIFKRRQLVLGKAVSRAPISFAPKTVTTAHSYVASLVTQACAADKKLRLLEDQWDAYLDKLISTSLSHLQGNSHEHLNDFVLQLNCG